MLCHKIPRLEPSKTTFETYTCKIIIILGKCLVNAVHSDVIKGLPVHVINWTPRNLLGKEWFEQLPNLLNKVRSINTNSLEAILKQYP